MSEHRLHASRATIRRRAVMADRMFATAAGLVMAGAVPVTPMRLGGLLGTERLLVTWGARGLPVLGLLVLALRYALFERGERWRSQRAGRGSRAGR